MGHKPAWMIRGDAPHHQSNAPTHVIDIDCPNGCGATIQVPCIETDATTRRFGADVVSSLRTVQAPTLHAQINAHLQQDCPCIGT